MNKLIDKSKVILGLLAVTLLAGLTACNVNDPDLPFDLEGTLNNNGAYLRVLSQEPFDIADGTEAEYVLTVEYYDGKEVPLLEDVQFYSDYTAFSLDSENDPDYQEIDEVSLPIVVEAAAFSENEDGNLQATVTVPLTTVTDALGLDISEVEVEDTFGIRWELNTTDGRTFSEEDRSTAVAGGFYSSPYFASVSVIQAIPSNMFVGEYEFVQTSGPGPIAGLGLPWLFSSETFTAELSVDPDNSLNGRVFSQDIYTAGNARDVPLSFGQTASIGGSVYSGYSCGAGLYFNASGSNLQLIDINDDSGFTVSVLENSNTDCGIAPQTITLEATKL